MDDLTLLADRLHQLRSMVQGHPAARRVAPYAAQSVQLCAGFLLVTLGVALAVWSKLLAFSCALIACRVAGRSWPAVAATILGLLWGRETALVAFTPLVVAAWWWSRSRAEACAVGTLYHFAAARETVLGAAHFLQLSRPTALLVVGACALIIGLVWAVCWSPRLRDEKLWVAALRLLVMIGVSHLPPIGALAVASPLSAAGSWFAGLGWAGLGLLFLCLLLSRVKWGVAAVGVFALISAATPHRAVEPSGFVAVSTDIEPTEGPEDFLGQYRVAHATLDAAAAHTPSNVLVFAESAGGLWQRAMRDEWGGLSSHLRGQGGAALLGAALPNSDGSFDNAVVGLGSWQGVYRQRVPVPFAMWRPWAPRGSYRAHWTGSGVVRVKGQLVGILVCWEAGLSWPTLASIAEGAEVLVATSNLGWFEGRGVWRAQRQTLENWGALFGLPVLLAANVEGGTDV